MTSVTVTYTAGIGFQYEVHRNGVFMGRYGNFNTFNQALRAGQKAMGLAEVPA